MAREISIHLSGEPVPWARARVLVRGDNRPSFYTPAARRKYRDAIRWAARAALGSGLRMIGPVTVSIVVTRSPPKRPVRQYPTVKPDLDNYIKIAMDALTHVVINDDAQVCELHAVKRYGDRPALHIDVREEEEDEGE